MRAFKIHGEFLVIALFLAALSAFAAGGASESKARSIKATARPDCGDATPAEVDSMLTNTMNPFSGISHPGVDVSTLTGKVMSGYQGWFNAEGDGSARGWTHWKGKTGFSPGSCEIDLWPDVSELEPDERYVTPFIHADGRPAEVFSAFNRKTVLRHFRWMKDYGIDGVFVQRFITDFSNLKAYRHVNVVLEHCREGANLYGRTYAVMYDLSGIGGGQMYKVMDDWKLLVDRMQITKDPAYLHHAGGPIVAIWGFGFNDGRRYTPKEGLELVRFLKHDPHYGGCTVILGLPTHWRTLNDDCVSDENVHELVREADIVSPWTIGRYTTPQQAVEYADSTLKPDMQWCKERGKEYLPVVFPGFSWHNMNPAFPLDQIPRLKGRFLWTQFVQAKKSGATMVYQAMFDEVNEATAIFKCSSEPPIGLSRFMTYEGVPNDFYLKLVGQASRMIRGEMPVAEQVPGIAVQAGIPSLMANPAEARLSR